MTSVNIISVAVPSLISGGFLFFITHLISRNTKHNDEIKQENDKKFDTLFEKFDVFNAKFDDINTTIHQLKEDSLKNITDNTEKVGDLKILLENHEQRLKSLEKIIDRRGE